MVKYEHTLFMIDEEKVVPLNVTHSHGAREMASSERSRRNVEKALAGSVHVV